MTIAVVGSINVDITAYAERLPKPGETLHGVRYLTGLGGKGANQAAAAAKLGVPTRLIGRVGDDHFGRSALHWLESFAVDIAYVRRDPANDTGIAIINVDARGENFITVIAGANFAVDESDVERARDGLGTASVLLLQLEVPWQPMMRAAEHARKTGAKVVLDPAPVPPNAREMDLSLIDVITPNEVETEHLTGIRPHDMATAAEAARRLHARGPKSVILKLGERGACLSAGEGIRMIEPFKVAAVDTVAAGDCFNGGLAYALSQGMDLGESARFACACGALSTTRYGAAAAAPALAEVRDLLARG
jgi:ribokinase